MLFSRSFDSFLARPMNGTASNQGASKEGTFMKRFLLGAIIALLAAPHAFSQTKNPSAVPEVASEAFAEAKRGIDKGNAEWIEAWEKRDPGQDRGYFY